ncbi:MAG: hypothetical protein EAY75_02380 [Bacteroidetes bacterium]|nr:MAG: hypothetical protein EAY75_02380 [Bacteroidota bacterium]
MMLVCVGLGVYGQGVSIGAPSPPDSSAVLDLAVANKGLLVPRLTTAQRQAILKPANALLVYNQTEQQFQVNIGSPTTPVWRNIVAIAEPSAQHAFWGTMGNAAPDSGFFVGTTNAQPLRLGTNNVVRLYLDSTNAFVGLHTTAPKASLHVQGTDAIIVPVGTTAQRPVVPQVGMIRYNATISKLEGYTSQGGWVPLQ